MNVANIILAFTPCLDVLNAGSPSDLLLAIAGGSPGPYKKLGSVLLLVNAPGTLSVVASPQPGGTLVADSGGGTTPVPPECWGATGLFGLPSGIDVCDPCGPQIPTVSEWGLLVTAILLATAGTVVFARRRSTAKA